MQEITIRGIDFDNIREVHGYLAEKLDFPDYYGNNLSALYDVLTDICSDTRIIMDLREMTDDKLSEELERMAEVISDAAGYNEYLEFECIG